MATTRLYRNGRLVESDFPVADISDHLAEKGCTVWADFVSPGPDDLAAIGEELGLHALAVEDAVHRSQRPKLDRYDSHLFLAAYATSLDPDTGELFTTEVKAFITRHAIVTVHDADFDMSGVVAKVTRLSPPGRSSVRAAGRLPTAIWLAGIIALKSQYAL